MYFTPLKQGTDQWSEEMVTLQHGLRGQELLVFTVYGLQK